VASKRQKKWEQEVFRASYRLTVYVDGYEDEAIEKAVGKESEGSGTDFRTGLRDLDFEGFKTERAAVAAAQRVKKAVRGARCVLLSSKRV
jgi:hypothetical protein